MEKQTTAKSVNNQMDDLNQADPLMSEKDRSLNFKMNMKTAANSINHHSVASTNPADPLMREKEQRLKIKTNMKVQFLTVSSDFGKISSP